MQEKLNIRPLANPWEVYFFEGGLWASLASFETESDAREYCNDMMSRADLPEDSRAHRPVRAALDSQCFIETASMIEMAG